MEGRNAQRDASRRTGSIVICVSDQASDAVASSLARPRADADERAVVVTGLLTPAGDRQYVAPAHRLADHVDLTFAAATAEHGRFDEVHVVGPLHSAAVLVRRLRATGDLDRTQVVVHPVAEPARRPSDDAGPDLVDRVVARTMVEEVSDHIDVVDDLTFSPPPPRTARVRGNAGGRTAVTVVVPVFDDIRFLAAAVGSVPASVDSDVDVEVLVVDDGSTDPHAVAQLDRLATDGVDGVHCTVLRRPHRGLAATRNAGIAAARTRFVVPLDADDLLPQGFVADAVAAARNLPEVSWVGGAVQNFGELDHLVVPCGWGGPVSLVLNTFPRATGLFRRDDVLAVGGYDESLPAAEDWDLYLRLHHAGYTGLVLPRTGQLYRRHRQSMTFRTSEAGRAHLADEILVRHAARLDHRDLVEVLRVTAQCWKRRHEPSRSATHLAVRPAASAGGVTWASAG